MADGRDWREGAGFKALRPDERRRSREADVRKRLRAGFGEEDERTGAEDVRAVMATPEGRRFMMMVVGRARVFGSVYDQCRQRDDLVYQTGRREFGCELYALVNRCAPGEMRRAFEERDALVAARNRRIEEELERIGKETENEDR